MKYSPCTVLYTTRCTMAGDNGRRWFVGAVVLAAAVNVSGQAPAPPPQSDVLSALLVEVKGLRAAMEQMATAGPRVQLFASRLQLQEGRMNSMARRLDTVRDSAATARREYDEVQEQLTAFETTLASNVRPEVPRAELEQQVAHRKRELKVAKGTLDRLVGEEN